MKRNFKTIAVCTLFVVAMMLSPVGCKAEKAAPAEEVTEEAVEEAPEEEEEVAEEYEPVSIEYWNVNTAEFGGPQVEQFIADFNETNGKNITVISVSLGNYMALATGLQASLVAGLYPGVIQVGYNALNYFAENFPQYTDPTTIVSEYAPEDANYLSEKYSPAVLELGKAVNGRDLGIPYSVSAPLLYYNKDIFRAAGLDPEKPPKTWQDVYDYCAQIKEKTGQYGLYIQSPPDTYSIIPMFLSNGIDDVYEPDGKGGYKTTFNNEKAVEAWTFLQSLSKNGYNANLAMEEGTGGFMAGEIGMYLTTSARASYVANNVDFDAGATMVPTFGDNKLQVCIGGNMLTTFAKTNNEVLACWEFIKYLLDSKQVNTWVRGTGYLPPTLDAPEDPEGLKPYFDEAPMLVLAIEERDAYARAWTSWPGPNGMQVDQYLIDMRDAIMIGQEDVATVIERTAETIDELIKGEE